MKNNILFSVINDDVIELSIDNKHILSLEYDFNLDVTLIFDAVSSEYLGEIPKLKFDTLGSVKTYLNNEIIEFILGNII